MCDIAKQHETRAANIIITGIFSSHWTMSEMFVCVFLPCKYKNKFKRIVAAALRCDRSSVSVGHQEEIQVTFSFAVKRSTMKLENTMHWSSTFFF